MHARAFLPGVPADHVLDRLAKAGGNEVESGNKVTACVFPSAPFTGNRYAVTEFYKPRRVRQTNRIRRSFSEAGMRPSLDMALAGSIKERERRGQMTISNANM